MQLSSWAWHHHHRWWHPPLKVTNPFQWNNSNIDYKSTKRSNFGVANIAALHTNQTERSSQPLLYWNMYQISVKMTINSRHHHFEELVVAQIRWSFVATIVKIVTFLLSTRASSYVSPKNFGQSRQSHTGCICLTFLRCAFSNVSSKRLHKKMQSYIGCICLTFLHCVFSNVSSNGLHLRIHNHIDCIYVT